MANWNWKTGLNIGEGLVSAPTSASITNIVETAGSVVTLTVTPTTFQFSVGDSIQLYGLTVGTWLNFQGPITLDAGTTATSLVFNDPTAHGTQASTPETGTVVAANVFLGVQVMGDANSSFLMQLDTNPALTPPLGQPGTIFVNDTGNLSITQASFAGGSPVLFVTGQKTTGFYALQQWNAVVDGQVVAIDNFGQMAVTIRTGSFDPVFGGVPAISVSAGKNNSDVQTWDSAFYGVNDFRSAAQAQGGVRPAHDLSINNQGQLVTSPNVVGTATVTTGDWTLLSLATAANAVSTTLSLTSVAASDDGTALYTGTITGGANNAFVGYSFVISGFTKGTNNTAVGVSTFQPGHPNGYPFTFFVCVASTATTLLLMNSYAVAESAAASAKYGTTVYTAPTTSNSYFGEGFTAFTLMDVGQSVNGKTVYTAPTDTFKFQSLAGQYFTISGFVNASNNGTFLVLANDNSSLTLANTEAVYETGTVTASLTLTSVATTANGNAVYTGTITGGAANAYRGYAFKIAGFVNAQNNGIWICTSSTATTLTLTNLNATTETQAATAMGTQPIATEYTISEIFPSLLSPSPYTNFQPITPSGLTTAAWLNGITTPALSTGVGDVSFTYPNEPPVPWLTLSQVAASTSIGPYTLTSVSTVVSPVSAAIYVGTITGGAANAYIGYEFTITGFTMGGNNVTSAVCIASTATTLTFATTTQANETNAASATGFSAVYTGTITGGAANGLRGHTFDVGGFANAANNGVFFCIASSATTLTLGNDSAVSETLAAIAVYAETPAPGNVVAETGTVTTVIGTTNQWAGFWIGAPVSRPWENFPVPGSISNLDPNNGIFHCISSTSSTITLANPIGVAETSYGQYVLLSNSSNLQEWHQFNNPFPLVTIDAQGVMVVGQGTTINHFQLAATSVHTVDDPLAEWNNIESELDVNVAISPSNSDWIGNISNVNISGASDYQSGIWGYVSNVVSTTSGDATGGILGGSFLSVQAGTGTSTQTIGVYAQSHTQDGVTTSANGIQAVVVVDTPGVVSVGASVRVGGTGASSGTFTQNYGIFVEDQTDTSGGATLTNPWAIFVAGGVSKFTGLGTAIVTKTTTYTVDQNDHTINGDTTGGAFTITLPTTGVKIGQEFYIKNIGTNTLTISSAANIDGTNSTSLTTQYESITVQWDGTQYWIY